MLDSYFFCLSLWIHGGVLPVLLAYLSLSFLLQRLKDADRIGQNRESAMARRAESVPGTLLVESGSDRLLISR